MVGYGFLCLVDSDRLCWRMLINLIFYPFGGHQDVLRFEILVLVIVYEEEHRLVRGEVHDLQDGQG